MDAKEKAELEKKKTQLFGKAMRMFPNSPAQLKVRKELEDIMKKLKESTGSSFNPNVQKQRINLAHNYRIYVYPKGTKPDLNNRDKIIVADDEEQLARQLNNIYVRGYDMSKFDVEVHKYKNGAYRKVKMKGNKVIEDIGQNVLAPRDVDKNKVVESNELYRIYIKDTNTGKNALEKNGYQYMAVKTDAEYNHIMKSIIPKYDQSRFEVTVQKNVGGKYKTMEAKDSIPSDANKKIDLVFANLLSKFRVGNNKSFVSKAIDAWKETPEKRKLPIIKWLKGELDKTPGTPSVILAYTIIKDASINDSKINVNELSKDDAVVRDIVKLYTNSNMSTQKKIAKSIVGKPYASTKELYDQLLDYTAKEILQLADEVGLNENLVKEAETNLPLLNKPKTPTKPSSVKKDTPKIKPETDTQKISRATQKLDITKRQQRIARTPRQKTTLQRKAQDQRKRLDALKKKN
jgi:hypothetical protein